MTDRVNPSMYDVQLLAVEPVIDSVHKGTCRNKLPPSQHAVLAFGECRNQAVDETNIPFTTA
jgi:hypothetical protein